MPASDGNVRSTKGGAGGAITTVSTVPELKAAVSGSTPGIILVKGALIGNGRVDVGSSKSIIGAAGSCEKPLRRIFARTRIHVISG